MKYKVTVETLTPLHIGTGTILLKDFDYVSKAGERRTYVLDQEAVYAAELEANGAAAQLNKPAGKLLSSEHWRPGSPFVRYTLRGSTAIEQVHEQIKDVQGRCYLPGSSLKGALRTALMSYAIRSGQYQPQVDDLERSAEWAARTWEKDVFGREPNYDLLRALQVTDSIGLEVEPSPLELCSARVFTHSDGEPGSPVVVEAIHKSVVFESEVTIDELALAFAPELGWNESQLWLVSLIEIIRQISRQRIEDELTIVSAKGLTDTESFYKQLLGVSDQTRGRAAAVLQMGWGTGWNGMTVGRALSKDAQDRVRQKYKLGRPPTAPYTWEPDLAKPFPKSRRLRSTPSQVGDDRPGTPFGWVVLVFTSVGQPSEEWQKLTRLAKEKFKPLAPAMVKPPTLTPARIEVEPETPPVDSAPHTLTRSDPPPEKRERKAIPAAKPLTATFTEAPKVGDRFRGEVFDAQGRTLYLTIPGLDDTIAYAVIAAEDNEGSKKYRAGDTVICEVSALTQEASKAWRVNCLRG